jgi:hypothetical protein
MSQVIISNGLPDGYEPPSASLDPPSGLGLTVAEAAVAMRMALGGCQHPNPEPVVLTTGEVVAAVCPDCLQPLPPSFVGSTWKA